LDDNALTGSQKLEPEGKRNKAKGKSGPIPTRVLASSLRCSFDRLVLPSAFFLSSSGPEVGSLLSCSGPENDSPGRKLLESSDD